MKLTDFGSQNQILEYRGGCHECPYDRKGFVPGTFRDTEIIIVGEAPGKEEVKQGKGFVGSSGKVLRKYLRRFGIQEFSLTNTVHCHPPGDETPTNKAVRCCMAQRTMEDVRGYSVVVLTGNTPIKAFFPDGNPKHLRGNFVYHPDYPGQRFYCTYHPAATFYGTSEEAFINQIRRLGRYMDEEEDPFEIYDGTGMQFLEDLSQVLGENDKISFDIETNQLESWRPGGEIKSFALTADGEVAYFAHQDEPHFEDALVMVADFLQQEEHKVIGHHIGFDLDWMEEKFGFSVRARGQLDTGVLFYHSQNYQMPSLKELVANEGGGYRHMVYKPHLCENPDILRRYNAEDVIYPWRLFHDEVQTLTPEQVDLYLRVASRTDLFYQRITSTGIHFDHENWEATKEEFDAELEQVKKEWEEDDDDFDPEILGSTDALREYIYGTKGLPVVKEVKTGPSTDKSTINQLIREEDADYLQHLLDYRSVNKLKTTFVDPVIEEVEQDGRIHADYRNTRTDTGRPSSKGPNMQNQPRDPRIRRMFGSRDGYVLMEADYSQIELRVMFSAAGEKEGIKAYQSGMDGHIRTAARITGKDPDDVTKEERTMAKPVNFGLCVPMDTEILTRDGWKSYDEVEVGDETLGFNGRSMEWTRITDKVHYESEPLVRTYNSEWSAVTTPDHRWFGDRQVDHGAAGKEYEPEFFRTRDLSQYSGHRIWLSQPMQAEDRSGLTPDEAAFIGWLYTDGSVEWAPLTGRTSQSGGDLRAVRCQISQHEDKFADEIRDLLARLGLTVYEDEWDNGMRIFRLSSPEMRALLRRCGLEDGSLASLVLQMGTHQLTAFVEAVQHAEGSEYYDYRVVSQNEGPVADAIELAMFLRGNFVSRTRNGPKNIRLRAKSNRVTSQKLVQDRVGSGPVWCVKTELGTWTMRQNEQIMVTGNCYGGSWYTLQRYARDSYGIDFSEAEAREFTEAFFDLYPYLRDYHDEIWERVCDNNGLFKSIVGHHHQYENWNHEDEDVRDHVRRAAINSQGQGTAAYMTVLTGIVMQREITRMGLYPEVQSVNMVHDSVMVEVKEEAVPGAVDAILTGRDEVAQWIDNWFQVPLEIDFEIGQNWGTLEEMEPEEIKDRYRP